jgi:predicted amidohydrolase YtcJ
MLILMPGFARAQDRSATANLIFFGGKVIVMEAAGSVTEAIAIRGGRIAALGTMAEVRKLAGPATRLIDLHGRTVTPGLIDAHLHFADVTPLYSVDLSRVESIAEVQRLVRERVTTAKRGEWITGRGWDEGKLREQRYVRADDLDMVAPHNPVWLTHATGHYAVSNSAALKMAHIDASTKDPPAGTIDRDAHGRPTGILKDAALDLVDARVPRPTHAQMRKGYLRLMRELNREGMTAIKDPGMDAENWKVYSELLAEKKLTIHLVALWWGGSTLEETQSDSRTRGPAGGA